MQLCFFDSLMVERKRVYVTSLQKHTCSFDLKTVLLYLYAHFLTDWFKGNHTSVNMYTYQTLYGVWPVSCVDSVSMFLLVFTGLTECTRYESGICPGHSTCYRNYSIATCFCNKGFQKDEDICKGKCHIWSQMSVFELF